MLRKLEGLKKGIEIVLPISLKKVRQTQIACVDDKDLFLIGEQCTKKMQETIKSCVKLYEATGAKTQEEKVMFYFWKCAIINGERAIEYIDTKAIMHVLS